MADFLKKVIPGQPMKIPAGAYNAFVDAANDYKSRQSNLGRDPDYTPLQNCVLSVKNDTTIALDRFAVVGIDAPVFTPADSLDEFLARFAVKGVKPTLGHAFRVGILVEPAGIGEVARAVFAGVTPAKIDITDTNHQYAGVADNVTGNLRSYASGPAAILWKEAGTGVKWAIVRIGGAEAPVDTTVVVKITGAGDTSHGFPYPEGGKYLGRMLTGQATTEGTGNLAMPEGMTEPEADDCIIINTAEDGGGLAWALSEGSYHVGKIVGQDVFDGLTIVAISSGGGGLPPGGSQYQVLQRNADGDGVWDWVRAH